MTNQEIIETIKYLNFCGLCTTGDCKNCERKIAKDKVLELLKLDSWISCDSTYNLPKYEELVDCTIKRISDNHIWVENLIYDPFTKRWKWTDYPEDRYVNEDTHKVLAWKEKSKPYTGNER